MNNSLIDKYNVPGPRYTSYPTVPFWAEQSFSISSWREKIADNFQYGERQISLYIHLPFCESLCTYCGCNTRITRNHEVERKYLNAVLKEWQMYLALLPDRPELRELHLGGGTPTFFSPENLRWLVESLMVHCTVSHDADFAFEGHPGNTTRRHLEVLYDLGFRRVSFGIQDFDSEVQRLIHRIQPFEQVQEVTHWAREIGFTSVNFDLIYGLPGQNEATISDSISKTLKLRPDRIAFYSYAHVPHLKPAQRSYEKYLPGVNEKRALYEQGKQLLANQGYIDIGMDHFALAGDPLQEAHAKGKLFRNFMGYSLQQTKTLIGLGVSAISDTWNAFAQNVKSVEAYYRLLEQDELPIFKGHLHTNQDLVVRQKILDIICRMNTRWTSDELKTFFRHLNLDLLLQLEEDGLIELTGDGINVLELGKPFVRNVCMAFDVRMNSQKETQAVFSKTV